MESLKKQWSVVRALEALLVAHSGGKTYIELWAMLQSEMGWHLPCSIKSRMVDLGFWDIPGRKFILLAELRIKNLKVRGSWMNECEDSSNIQRKKLKFRSETLVIFSQLQVSTATSAQTLYLLSPGHADCTIDYVER
ncbi:hypothetical protein SARC_05295 [Sphaeroforma arctica JP610]|uniref:Uncharacterized protein n=1 Tax=Sphaeroforma arctica JP610 TaxID=667725 RepID=A0A0L0G030_9EUKA|nr:hypothetical protein SARC_05295 [Sphaeroforma arctica JP610]KNC82425.1 hypothetical protein SARC_05295 [Sphaeroforma arctica JP610]|eukprot:XP_014156327.1 hypothetical protein SARC_05295 [Sphaeroforma arctica JP610]